ncbi:hypothetical protein [Levilactobacillus namurensis]|uniref:Uncharacterized protein n=1 Tax=Levilactobacillus namurensis TaxID=380393 RepID=A0AAW8W605_9LACO|nr:hypothetical protein [Levilactobacillus namurensis]MDT7014167.1 hypothetical protein [Levilactobacillus namurensis]
MKLRKRRRRGCVRWGSAERQGWLLPDTLLALSLVAGTLAMTQQTVVMTRHWAVRDEQRLRVARQTRAQALLQVVQAP